MNNYDTLNFNSHVNMRNIIADVFATLSLVSFNIYSLFEILNKTAFPIILALGSISLTVMMIIIQIRKKALLNKQIKCEELKAELTRAEIEKVRLETQKQDYDFLKEVNNDNHNSITSQKNQEN